MNAGMDMSRFHATFFEESRECLDSMESGLLALESGQATIETVNTVFRAAHSIKGGAATFGFQAVAGFTHVLETLLDEMRSGRREISPEASNVLLDSVDVLRMLLQSAEHGNAVDADALATGEQRLQEMMGVATPAKKVETAKPKPVNGGWQIDFRPQPSLYMTGNDPLRIFRELERLGPLQATCNGDKLPGFNELDPFQAHLAWDLHLETAASREAIEEAFAWVQEECDLSLQSITPPAQAVTESVIDNVSAIKRPNVNTEQSSSNIESSIRVGIGKVDTLINLVGELVITQAMLKQASSALNPAQHEQLLGGLVALERNTRDLQESVMSVRMLPMESVFSRFPRVVRDMASKLGKQVRLKTIGESTELDKGVIEKIIDPLNHLVRNAVDHGLEPPDVRRKAGKDETGTVTLKAMHQGGHIVIEVSDDGRGLDRSRILRKAAEHGIPVSDAMPDNEVWQLIFHPGLSTAEKITDVSGRGVGMDVVKKNVVSLGGQIDIVSSTGAGSSVIIRLPLTLAILDGMSVAVGEETFILPLASVLESLQPRAEDIRTITGSGRLVHVRGNYLPLLALHEVFGVSGATNQPQEGILVLVESENRKLALLVDALVGQQQVVIKNLESNYRRVTGISGATILGNGRVSLIVDIGGLSRNLAVAA